MWDWFVDVWNNIVDIAADVISTVVGYLADVYEPVIDLVTDVVDTVVDKVTDVYDTVVDKVEDVVDTVTNTVSNVYNTVSNYVTNVYNTVSNYVTNVYNTYATYITNVIGVTIEKVAEWFTSIGGATRAWVEGLFVTAGNTWNTIIGNLASWWRTQLALLNETFGWVLLFRDIIEEFFTDPEEWLYKAVDRIIERFW